MTTASTDGWQDIISPATAAGVRVTTLTSLGVPAVLRAVTLLAGAVASLPLKVYRKTSDGRIPATGHPVDRLLQRAPNSLMTPFTFKELIMNCLLLNGNFYAYIESDQASRPAALWPIDPNRVIVEQDTATGAITYRVSTTQGQQILAPVNVLHVLGVTLDGIRGVSPVTLARESIGGAIAELKHGQSFFKNGAAVGGVLQHPGHLGPKAAETLRTSWREKYSGSDNAGKVAILEEGMTFNAVALSNKDSQWLESRQVTVLDIARIFGVPPALLGHLEKASYSSQEAQNLEFLTHSLRPWLTRIEQAIERSLLVDANVYVEFTTGDLLRTDLKTRYDAYRTALAAGWMSVNEVRRLENLPAVAGGDEIYRPMNMEKLGGSDNGGQG
ncbi:MAG: phage portal protein [Bacillota bacterium]